MEKALEMIGQLAAKLGQTTEALWPHVVRHTAIEGGASLLIGVFVLAVLVVGLVGTYRTANKDDWFTSDGPRCAAVVIFLVLCLITFITSVKILNNFSENVSKFLEPTGHTIKEIIKGIK